MLKTLVLTFSILAIVGLAFVFADNETVKVKTDALTGKIVSVETEKKAITVVDAEGNKTIYLFNDASTFFRDGKTIEVTTLVPDEEITFTLSPDEKNIILRLDTPKVIVEEKED